MSTLIDRPLAAQMRHDLGSLRGNWLWFVALGIALMVLGTVALGSVAFASLATAVVVGALILASGLAETAGAFWCRAWSGFLIHLLVGVLSIVVGVMLLRAPVDALLTLTLLVTCYLLVGGIFKIVAAMSYRFASWGWPLASGVIDVILGAMIWRQFPGSAFWVIGLFVGISLLFRGANWIGLGLALRSMPRRASA